MIEFLLGLIIGLLVNPFRKDVVDGVSKLQEKIKEKPAIILKKDPLNLEDLLNDK